MSANFRVKVCDLFHTEKSRKSSRKQRFHLKSAKVGEGGGLPSALVYPSSPVFLRLQIWNEACIISGVCSLYSNFNCETSSVERSPLQPTLPLRPGTSDSPSFSPKVVPVHLKLFRRSIAGACCCGVVGLSWTFSSGVVLVHQNLYIYIFVIKSHRFRGRG